MQPWGSYHALNVACYFLEFPEQSSKTVLEREWTLLQRFLREGLPGVHALTASAVKANNHRWPQAARGITTEGKLPSHPLGKLEFGILDVAVDGSFPAAGYPERMLRWAQSLDRSWRQETPED